MKKILQCMFGVLAGLLLYVLAIAPVLAGSPQGLTGAPPTTMIGPLTATKTELVDGGGGYSIGAVLALNTSAAVAFVQFFDQPCATVTLGTTRPSWVQPVKATDWSYVSFPFPLGFFTPICAASTTTPVGLTGSAVNSVYMQVFIP